ncbi:IS200/IS605 family transposase, partial [Bifidobacterium pseudocatenulatum]|uniref:IS200/IS605 family transposase n=1 Tax=Bifidobacterium pseudocatenulatum TaxID=28026 RepID=UPI0034A5C3C4
DTVQIERSGCSGTSADSEHLYSITHSKFINAYKSASSRLLKQEFPQIRQKLWKEYFWSRSFCLLTTGGAPIEVVRRYIENQGRR